MYANPSTNAPAVPSVLPPSSTDGGMPLSMGVGAGGALGGTLAVGGTGMGDVQAMDGARRPQDVAAFLQQILSINDQSLEEAQARYLSYQLGYTYPFYLTFLFSFLIFVFHIIFRPVQTQIAFFDCIF